MSTATATPLGEIVLYSLPTAGGEYEEFPAIIHRENADGTVDLTPFTGFIGGPAPVQRVERAPADEPAPECWRPRP